MIEACRAGDGSQLLDAFAAGIPMPVEVIESCIPASTLDDLRSEEMLELLPCRPDSRAGPGTALTAELGMVASSSGTASADGAGTMSTASGEQQGTGRGVLRTQGDSGLQPPDALVALTVSCQSVNGIVSILPARQARDADLVYLNGDSIWLLHLAWTHGTPGERAAELGTGNGLVASYLVARYRCVIATDIHEPSLQFARLTLEANRGRGRPSAVVRCDIGSALRPGAFDLVVANAPWSPGYPPDDRGRSVTFADGGPTGTELPARFVDDTIDLLAPGGVGIVLALDTVFDDGRRPLHDIVEAARNRGVAVSVERSPVFDSVPLVECLAERVPGLVGATHVGLVLRR